MKDQVCDECPERWAYLYGANLSGAKNAELAIARTSNAYKTKLSTI